MNEITDLRLALLANGYTPLPASGKEVFLPEWTTRTVTAADVRAWETDTARWRNTGARDSGLDADIRNPEAAEASRQEINDWFGARGHVLRRIGEAPKFFVPLRVKAPFAKIAHRFRAPNGVEAKIEFLCAPNQQFIVAGIHPDTRKPYTWCDGRDLTNTPCSELPEIDEEEAHDLVRRLGDLLVEEHSYTRAEDTAPNPTGTGAPPLSPPTTNANVEELLAAMTGTARSTTRTGTSSPN